MQALSSCLPGLAPAGHYASAMVHGGLVHVSGTLPAPDTLAQPFEAQMRSLLAHCDAVLQQAGSDATHVLSLTVYLTDLGDWEQADALLADYFGAHRPARAMLNVQAIRKGFAVQATLVAATRSAA